jgi:hypothetical protein
VARRADHPLGIDPASSCLLDAIEIITLSIGTGQQRTYGRQFVAADAAVDDRLFASLRVEGPAPVGLDKRNRKRPVVRADIQLRAPRAFLVDRVLRVVEGNESSMEFPVGVAITGVDGAVGLE